MANDLECCVIVRGPLSMQEQVDFCPTVATPNTNPTRLLGNVSVFQVAPEFEEKTKKDFRKATGNACQTKLISSLNVNLTVDCMKSDILALAQGGEATDIATSAITNETHRVNADDDIIHLNFIASKTAFAVTNVGGATTYTLGVDYTLITSSNDADAGVTGIQVIPSGAIVSAADIEFDYTRIDQKSIDPYIFVDKVFTIWLDGFNAEDGSSMYVQYYKVKLGSATTIDWINDDYAQLQFEGEILFDDCNNAYGKILRGATA